MEKFFFDENKFDEPQKPKEPEAPPPPTFSEEELAAARQEAYDRGLEDGVRQGKDEAFQSIDQEISQKISALSVQIQALNEAEEARRRLFEREAVALTLSVCEKLLPDFKKISQGRDLEGFVLSKIAQEDEPEKLSIRIHPDQAKRLEEIINEKLPGVDLTVRSDPSMDIEDVVISWGDGGVQRKVAQVQAQIMQVLEDELARFDAAYGVGMSETGGELASDMGETPVDAEAEGVVLEEDAELKRSSEEDVSELDPMEPDVDKLDETEADEKS